MRRTIFYAIIINLLMIILTACSSGLSQVKDAVEKLSPGAKVVSVQEVNDERVLENAQDYIAPGMTTVVVTKEGEIRNATAWCVVFKVA